ncbi:MAG: WcbI family polysaccharide biosynthesis putative acetyltransferase, partial [Actinomycetota bacterium]|nr:WcbI family polysaccharide biosynthesis putative acetyltransferase [Actinomycetota bacterium]
DLAPLGALLPRLDLLVTQPVGDDYRGLPVGTRQLLARTSPGLRHVLVPSLRYAGRSPHHVLVHPPHLPQPDPPVVPYHDLRTVVRAAWEREGLAPPPAPTLTPEAVRAVAADSVGELRRREEQHETIVASDLLTIGAHPSMRTINHPGNDLFAALAVRVREALGLDPRPTRLTRALLNGIHAPVEPAVAAVFGDVSPRSTWIVDGREVDVETVEREQATWYRGRGDVVDEILRRSGRQMRHLGLVTPAGQARAAPSTDR